MDMQGAIKELQETAIVMAGIQTRQASALKDHADWLLEQQEAIRRHERNMARIELGLAEATDKLNALIHIVDDQGKK